VTLPYVLSLADHGAIEAARQDPALAKGFNTYLGKLTVPGVAEAFGLTLDELPL